MIDQLLVVRPREVRMRDQDRRDPVHDRPEPHRDQDRVTAEGAGVEAALHRLDQVIERRALAQILRPHVLLAARALRHEQDPVLLGILDPEPDIRLPPKDQRLDGVGRLRAFLLDERIKPREVPLADREDQLVLVPEMEVDRRRCNADRVGNGADRHCLLVAGLYEQPLGCFDDLRAQTLAFTTARALARSSLRRLQRSSFIQCAPGPARARSRRRALRSVRSARGNAEAVPAPTSSRRRPVA